ncbi:hypothetical protein LOK49_LG07G00368 [Camellia lanceoleosa]|uniref:Uncharacterized protein n=1 Tax=Camellia lanceoleosa TaxID=1840588 RepID=A0ACC0H7I2_9ERIC|nr:hypothetical protein LOK49_LG07G00368 [Camellia lanceoleosa]
MSSGLVDTSREVTTHSGRPLDSLFNDHRQPVPQMPRPALFFPENHHSVDNFGPFVETQSATGFLKDAWGLKHVGAIKQSNIFYTVSFSWG